MRVPTAESGSERERVGGRERKRRTDVVDPRELHAHEHVLRHLELDPLELARLDDLHDLRPHPTV